ncbi:MULTISPECIES: flagellar hook-associated protein FlgL [Bacillus]|uniref:flagellar hook-associated protein FlgL n=1 Tax=Bacillus TaxID=1386 RepID=UPI00065E1B47|nr:flagellar hook-associated protein FlgL [Bacillus smithii]AKP45834.1 Flagellar hook-associated protein FlgL [Bacillus smithii]MED4883506.1 flagellar hook-associated protein FlgL [Bacillus smithii]MED4928363.1 flagellar hook-associated protein FlgL [Bacillus smithii]
MRVTQSMLSNNMLRNLSSSYERLSKYQDQISTGKKVNRPSDDPVVVMKGISYRADLSEVQQYKRNFSEAYNWIENSDAALDNAGQALQRIRELVVEASNDTYDASQRQAISAEIKQLRDHLAEVANTKFGDKYLFNGANTTKKPVDLQNGNYPSESQPTEPVEIELSKGIYLPVNVPGEKVFGEQLFSDLKALTDDLDQGKNPASYLDQIDQHIDAINNARADLGARQNRLEMMESRVDNQEVIATKVLSDNEDVDYEKAITDLTAQESVHRAALAVGARVLQPTLMDFLT